MLTVAVDNHRLDPDRQARLGVVIPLAAFTFFSIDVVVLYLSFES